MARQEEPAWFFDSSNMMLFVTGDVDPMCLEMLLCMHYGRCRQVPFLMVNNALSEGRLWIGSSERLRAAASRSLATHPLSSTQPASSAEMEAVPHIAPEGGMIGSALADSTMKAGRSLVGNATCMNSSVSEILDYERPAYDPPMCRPLSRQSSVSSSTPSESVVAGDDGHSKRHRQGITITGSAVSQILIAESPLGVLQVSYYSTEQLTTLERFAVQFMVGNEGMTISIRNGRIMIR